MADIFGGKMKKGSLSSSPSIFWIVRDYFQKIVWEAKSIFVSCSTAWTYLYSRKDFTKEVTEQYPDPISSKTPDDLPPRFRGFLHNEIERCIGCYECQKRCPVQCIHIETEPEAVNTKVWVSVFDIDFSKCIFCGLCTEVCPPGSLKHKKEYEGAVYSTRDLVVSYGRGQVTEEQREKWARVRKQIEEDASVL